MTIAVIGAGASGMMAALTAAEQPENKILLFERQARVGRKLAVTRQRPLQPDEHRRCA